MRAMGVARGLVRAPRATRATPTRGRGRATTTTTPRDATRDAATPSPFAMPPPPLDGAATRAPPPPPPTPTSTPTGAFVDYGVYKTKGAMKVKAVRATFERDANGRRVMKRAGGVLLELANATAPRQYDWGNKGSFMLSATEAAELVDRMASHAPCAFFHDPGAGSANRGAVNKAFKVEPMPDGSGGLFVNLQTTSAGRKSFVSVPVSYGESAALRHILAYLVPKIAGFDEVFR